MGFNINIESLTESTALNTAIQKENFDEDYIYNFLDFNNNIHRLITEAQLAKYGYYLQYASNESNIEVYQEGVMNKIKNTIKGIFLKIKQAFIWIINKIQKLQIDHYKKIFEEAKNNSKINIKILSTIFITSSDSNKNTGSKGFETLTKKFEEYTKKVLDSTSDSYDDIIKEVDELANKGKNPYLEEVAKDFGLQIEGRKDLLGTLFNIKNGNTNDASTIYSVTSNYENVDGKKLYEIGIAHCNLITNLIECARKNIMISNKFDKYIEKQLDDASKKLKDNNKFDNVQKALTKIASNYSTVVNFILNAIKATYQYAFKIVKALTKFAKNPDYKPEEGSFEYKITDKNSINKTTISAATGKIVNPNESTLFGDEYDQDILTAGMDELDFNRTEWMDLKLSEGWHNYEIECREAYKEAYIAECKMYLSESGPSVERLQLINEIMDRKQITSNMESLWQKLEEVVKEFFRKLDEKINLDVPYLKKYESTLKDQSKGFPEAMGPIKSRGYLLTGMSMVTNFNYNTLQFDYSEQTKDNFKDKDTYFNKIILPKLTKQLPAGTKVPTFDPNTSYIDYLKKIFGGPINKEPTVEYKVSEFKNKTQEILNFLYNSKKHKSDISRMKDIAKRSANSKDLQYAKTPKENNNTEKPAENTKPPEGQGGQATPQTNVNASMIWSFVQGKYIHEIEMTDQKVNPNSQVTEKDDSYANAKKVYIGVIQDIIKAQMTGLEFMRNEYMAMIKWTVNYWHPTNGQVKKGNK